MSEKKSLERPAQTATRRQVIASLAVAFSGLALGSVNAWAGTDEEISHSEESIHQVTVFKASRKRVYEALVDTKEFDKFTMQTPEMKSGQSLGNAPTKINREVGGAFTIFGGHIVGRQIELVPNERIVQAWRVVDWDRGVYSVAKFELLEQGSGTKLVFDHTAFPKGQAQHLADGWKSHYWEPMEKFLT